MRKRVSSRRWRSCGRTCRTRSASSTRCATRRRVLTRPISRSRRPCASSCSPSYERCASNGSAQIPKAKPEEAEQLEVLDDYASGMLTALNTDGLQPFTYATVEAAQALDEVEASLQRLEKKGPR